MKKEKALTNIVVPKIFIRETGIFNIEKVLQNTNSWLWENKYYVIEKEHTEKVKSHGIEFVIEWNAYRKIDSYLRFHINVLIEVWEYNPITIEKKGKKIKTGKGRIEITIMSELEKDYGRTLEEYQQKFQDTPLGRFLRIIYERFLIKERILKAEEKLHKETYTLHDKFKSTLGLIKKKEFTY